MSFLQVPSRRIKVSNVSYYEYMWKADQTGKYACGFLRITVSLKSRFKEIFSPLNQTMLLASGIYRTVAYTPLTKLRIEACWNMTAASGGSSIGQFWAMPPQEK